MLLATGPDIEEGGFTALDMVNEEVDGPEGTTAGLEGEGEPVGLADQVLGVWVQRPRLAVQLELLLEDLIRVEHYGHDAVLLLLQKADRKLVDVEVVVGAGRRHVAGQELAVEPADHQSVEG